MVEHRAFEPPCLVESAGQEQIKTLRILLVEDNLPDVRLVKEALREWQIAATVEHYDNGEDAASALAAMSESPDVILLDINVPVRWRLATAANHPSAAKHRPSPNCGPDII